MKKIIKKFKIKSHTTHKCTSNCCTSHRNFRTCKRVRQCNRQKEYNLNIPM